MGNPPFENPAYAPDYDYTLELTCSSLQQGLYGYTFLLPNTPYHLLSGSTSLSNVCGPSAPMYKLDTLEGCVGNFNSICLVPFACAAKMGLNQ